MSDRAAVRCSERIRSTVGPNGVNCEVDEKESPEGEPWFPELFWGNGLNNGEEDSGDWAQKLMNGVWIPGVAWLGGATERLRTSDAALNSRFVVPKALVEPDLAEHTIATL